MQAEIISLGTELITGSAVDTNSAYLSARLARCGVAVTRHTTLGDDRAAIAAAFTESAGRADLVISTGGLGPTQDDLTRHALADAMGVTLDYHDASHQAIARFFAAIDRQMSASNAAQAMFPAGATPLANEWGTAPGIQAALGRATVFCVPGVPREMRAMFDHYIAPHIAAQGPGRAIAFRVLRTFGTGESVLAEQIADLMTPGRNPSVGTTASEGVISVRIVATADDQSSAGALADADAQTVQARLGQLVYGEDDDTLASVAGRLLADRGRSIATAESCTGGLIATMLTDVPGSSRYFLGGFVTYSNAQKTAALGVPADLIETHGAVSEPVAEAMANGCRRVVGSDYAIGVTGVAGPDGGTADKPVGLVYIALATPDETRVKACRFSHHLDRAAIRDRAAKTALNLLRRRLSE